MADDINNDLLKELEAALSVKPSPEFTARVRERVRQEPAKTSWGWWSLAAASVVIALIGVASVTTWTSGRNGGPGLQTRPIETPAAIVQAGSEDPALHSVPLHSVVVPVVARSHEPEVLVPKDQAIALRHLLADMDAGRIEMDSMAAPFEAPKIALPTIQIERVTVSSADDGIGGL